MNGKSYKWLMKSLGSLSLVSAVVMLPIILAGCSDDSSSSTVPLPPPPPPAPPPAPPAPPAPPPTPTPDNLLLSVVVTRTSSGGSGLGEETGLLPGGTVTGVSINTAIRFRFGTPVNEAPLLQALSLRASSGASVAPALANFTFNADRTEVIWTPPATLQNDQTYTLTITARPDLFADGRPLVPSPQTFTFTTGATAIPAGPLTFLPSQLGAVTPIGQVFSNPNVIPVGYGIRRAGAAENLPVGVYSDYRSVLSFPLPTTAVVPANAVVQTAQLTLVQLPSNGSTSIGALDLGNGFFFLDITPHNIPSNNVVFQEVTLGSPNNVISNDFFAPASTPSFIALSINGNVLGGDVSAGPRTADVTPGVQRAVSGNRFYQIRLQCAKEVWNNQATPVFAITTQLGTASASSTSIITLGSTQVFTATASATLALTGPEAIPGTTTVQPDPFTVSINPTNTGESGLFTVIPDTVIAEVLLPITLGGTFSYSFGGAANATFQATAFVTGTVTAAVPITGTTFATTSSVRAGFEVSQGANGVCRAEFDKDPGAGTGSATAPITTTRGPKLDITFTVPR